MTTPLITPSYGSLPASARLPRLLALSTDPESPAKRVFYGVLAVAIALLYFALLMRFFAPAPGLPGIDENAYLVGGKNLAAHGTPGMTQPNPYSYMGSMWIRTDGTAKEVHADTTTTPPAAALDVSGVITELAPGQVTVREAQPTILKFSSSTAFFINGAKSNADNLKVGMHLSATMTDGWYYPKYPAGVPLLNAIAIILGGSSGKFLAFYVSPLCAAGAVLGMFFLGRALAGSFLGLMGMIILASNPTLMWFANVPGSHAPATFFSIWGMVFLLDWWKSGKWWVGVLAGLALGYTFTTRYSEGLLILPLLAACIATVRYEPFTWIRQGIHAAILAAATVGAIIFAVHTHYPFFVKSSDPAIIIQNILHILAAVTAAYGISVLVWGQARLVLRALVPVAAWFFVVGGLLVFNRLGSDHWTGYDSTNESSGFTYSEFMGKWEFTVQQLYMYGLFLVLPLGLMGMALMFQRAWKLALVMVLWLVPGLILYTAYYWGTQAPGVGFTRFFLTLFAPVIASALWLLASASSGAGRDTAQKPRGKIALPIGAGLLTAATAAAGVYVSLPYLQVQFIHNANLEFSARRIAEVVPLKTPKGKPTPVVFADMSSMEKSIFPQLIMYMQFMGDCDWYTPNAFYPYGGGAVGMMGLVGGMGNDNKDNKATLLDPVQLAFQQKLYANKKVADLVADQNHLMATALDNGRPVYAILRKGLVKVFKTKFIVDNETKLDKFEMKRLAVWTDPLGNSFDEKPPSRNSDRGNGLSPQPMQLDWLDSDRQPLEIWQITRKAPATQPATQAH